MWAYGAAGGRHDCRQHGFPVKTDATRVSVVDGPSASFTLICQVAWTVSIDVHVSGRPVLERRNSRGYLH
jgi:hypothetical protein